MRIVKSVILAAVLGLGLAAPVCAEEAEISLPHVEWPHDGIFGTFDRAAAQRGFQVYKEICSACHSLNLLYYRDLTALGFSDDEVKAIAAQYQVQDGPNDQGEMYDRPALPSDHFKRPFPNDKAARAANNGALPPDLSLIVKAREGGEDYVHAMLTGFEDPPVGVKLMDGMNYNKYFPGHQMGMPPILQPDLVTYADGTKATQDQMATDVATFLTWAAEPNLEERKRMGVKVVLFLLVFAGLMYAVKRQVWADAH
ncbi:MAG: cytochrome c1 [Azospirillaceae bacterium]|nr:cytochrome c1 [Azospirillaceae bacterium]